MPWAGLTVSDATDGSDGSDGSTDATDGSDGATSTDGTDVSDDATDGTSDGVDGGPIGCTVPENIAALINSKCGGCHTGGGSSGGFKFDPAVAIANTVGVTAKGGYGILIVPGAANESYLMQKLNGTGGGSKMPLNGTLTPAEIVQFASWIDALQCDATDGVDGTDGTDGTDGVDGTDGTDGTDGVDGTTDATDGVDGTDGTDGADGGFIPAGCLNAGALCNPLTNGGCANADEACDISSEGIASCFPPPNDVPLGGACNNAEGPFCTGTLHCNAQTAKCEKFCCSKSDCTGGLTCVQIDPNFGAVGTCGSGAPPVP